MTFDEYFKSATATSEKPGSSPHPWQAELAKQERWIGPQSLLMSFGFAGFVEDLSLQPPFSGCRFS